MSNEHTIDGGLTGYGENSPKEKGHVANGVNNDPANATPAATDTNEVVQTVSNGTNEDSAAANQVASENNEIVQTDERSIMRPIVKQLLFIIIINTTWAIGLEKRWRNDGVTWGTLPHWHPFGTWDRRYHPQRHRQFTFLPFAYRSLTHPLKRNYTLYDVGMKPG